MHILILSNYYPPSRSWGYTQLCHEVVERLRSRGHRLAILTSRDTSVARETPNDTVIRKLHLESEIDYYRPLNFFFRRRARTRENLQILQHTVDRLGPDVIFIWGMWNLSKRIPALAEQHPNIPVVYYLADQWPSLQSPHQHYWQLPAHRWYLAPIKEIANRLALGILQREGETPTLKLEHPVFVSQALKQIFLKQGLPVEHGRVIYNGIDVSDFAGPNGHTACRDRRDRTLRMLVAGRLAKEKGTHTAIEALHYLVQRGYSGIHLTLVGEGRRDYEEHLRSLVRHKSLNSYVHFRGRVPREQMPDVLRAFDLLIFPSIYEEPLARMPMEAMAAGLAVIGTSTGGTPELIEDGITGLTFPPSDAAALAARIERLLEDPTLIGQLARQGYALIESKFGLQRMVDEIELYLREVVSS